MLSKEEEEEDRLWWQNNETMNRMPNWLIMCCSSVKNIIGDWSSEWWTAECLDVNVDGVDMCWSYAVVG